MRYYYRKGQRVSGPFDFDRLRDCLHRGTIDAKTPVAAAAGGNGPPTETWGPLNVMLPALFKEPAKPSVRTRTEPSSASRPAAPAPAPSLAVLACAVGMLAAFFMPWVQAFGFGVSGYGLSKLGSYGNYAWGIPLLAGTVVLVTLNGMNNRVIGLIAGIVPLAAILFGLAKLSDDVGSGAALQVLDLGTKAIASGAWLTIVSSVGIILSSLVPPPAGKTAQHPIDTRLHEVVKPMTAAAAATWAAQPSHSVSEEVSRLAELHAKGALSPDEFQAAKASLFGRP